jgi:CHAT domain-containing protein
LAPHDPNAAALAARVLLQRKGRVLDAMTDSLDALKQHSDPEDQALLDQLRAITAHIARLVLKGTEKISLSEYRKSLAELKEKKEELEAEVSRHSAEFRSASQPVTLETVQSTLPANTALLEFVSYRPFDPKAVSNSNAYAGPRYAVYIIRKTGIPQGIDLGDAKQLQLKIENFRRALRDPLSTDLHPLSRDLDQTIMQPVRGLLRDAKQLLISPDGDLNLIPFEALVDEQGHYLVQRYSISYLTTGRDLLRMQVARASHGRPVIVANPSFGEPQGVEIAGARPIKLQATSLRQQRRSVTTASDLSSVYFAPLEGTAQEARSIKTLFPDANVLTGTNASKTALKQVNAPEILHIATHGFFLTGFADQGTRSQTTGTRGIKARVKIENPLLRSGLALAGANLSKDAADNGILTALEASGLNLWGTKLVTLSACDTGVGEVKNGEGVYGLRRAFMLSGTETLVMSLWPVSDYVTREMMTTYYTGLKNGLGRGEALRQAELSMMKRKGREHPFYWASFIQAGEWGNLAGKR